MSENFETLSQKKLQLCKQGSPYRDCRLGTPSSRAESRIPASFYPYDYHGILTRTAPDDGALQHVVPVILHAHIFYLSRYPTLPGHPGENFVRHNAATFLLAKHGEWCVKLYTLLSLMRQDWISADAKADASALLAKRLLEFMANGTLGPPPRTATWNQHMVKISDRFSKLAWAIRTGIICSLQMTTTFLNNWVMSYEIPSHIFSENGPQFRHKSSKALCLFSGEGTHNYSYHPDTSKHAELNKCNIVARLWHCISEDNRDWHMYVHPLTYTYNTQAHRGRQEHHRSVESGWESCNVPRR